MRRRESRSGRLAELKRQFGAAPCSSPILRRLYWALRGFQYWLCFYDNEAEIEDDDLLTNPFNTMPPSLAKLHDVTHFDKAWLMFLYRNFKQRCPTGRMGPAECRTIFRQLFPRAAHYAFADRVFAAITRPTGRQHITYEDLVFCLYDLTTASSTFTADLSASSATSTATFIANVIGADERGRITEDVWLEYASAVWGLRASRSAAAASAAAFGLGGSVHVSSRKSHSSHSESEDAGSRRLAPLFAQQARARFRELDRDADGVLLPADIELEIRRLYAADVLLHKTRAA